MPTIWLLPESFRQSQMQSLRLGAFVVSGFQAHVNGKQNKSHHSIREGLALVPLESFCIFAFRMEGQGVLIFFSFSQLSNLWQIPNSVRIGFDPV